MVDDTTLDLVRNTLFVVLKIVAPVLAAGVAIGLIISILQSVTQIQEQTLSMVPKIFVMTIVTVILMPWIAGQLSEFAVSMFSLAD